MPYPTEPPSQKHDLVVPRDFPTSGGSLSNSPYHVTSSALLVEKLQQPMSSNQHSICFLFSYPDAPDPPLSRALYIVAVCPPSQVQSLVRLARPCTLAVRRGDSTHHVLQLDEKHKINSPRFVKLLGQLYHEGLVAILGMDKHERFGILVSEGSGQENDKLSYCATCYVGKYKHVLEHLKTKDTIDEEQKWEPTTPPPAEEEVEWNPTTPPFDSTSANDDDNHSPAQGNDNLWKPPTPDDNGGDMWQPPTNDVEDTNGFGNWQPHDEVDDNTSKRKAPTTTANFHQDSGAAAADAFYSGLTRSLDTRSESRLFHMRAFNGWVKATQIQELDPKTGGGGLRVLDLACGKGGDLGKWVLHSRGIRNYVGVDVARGSLRDAALRARKMKKKLHLATFTVADLGSDVPGRLRTKTSKQMQKLMSWSLQDEPEQATEEPDFRMVRGGGIAQNDKFDIVSIQFAIHYMFSSRDRARRFFQTVSELLEVGGNLIATTIDARIVLEKVMDLGLDLHHYDEQKDEGALVMVGGGACRIQFTPEKTKQIFDAVVGESKGKFNGEKFFGLEYTFTLVEGSDHGAGVGDAVNLPEWLNPIPVLMSLAAEAGLELESAENFHEFFANRKDPSKSPAAHRALYNMKVLDRNGSIPPDNWEVSRLYCALKFRKVRESTMILEEDDEPEEEEEEALPPPAKVAKTSNSSTDKKLIPMAMIKAKKIAGDRWNDLGADEKKELIQVELEKLKW